MYREVDTWLDIVAVEKEVLDFWKANQIFEKLVEKNRHGEPWSFLDGPITANDQMGLHHAWGRALKDAFQRFHAMDGRRLRYQNGFDCQGLWVEVEVEKELKLTSKRDIEEYGVARFVDRCRKRVKKYARIITEQSIRLGYWMDWAHSYYTMSDENNYMIWSFLKKCHERGYIYKGHDVMPWCPRCGTGISQHEMQEGYRDVEHLSVVVEFKVEGEAHASFLVWTTTPWTLPANVVVAVHPDLQYVRVRQNDRIHYLGKDRMHAVLREKGDWEVLQELSGQQVLDLGLHYRGPFDDLPLQAEATSEHRAVGWKAVLAQEGTGIVHVAPGCGAEDHLLGRELGLPAVCPIDEQGRFSGDCGWLSGRKASAVGQQIVGYLRSTDALYSAQPHRHSYPHCWRCKHELLFRLVDEWYIAMDPWRDDIKHNAEKIRWIPSFGKDLELDWLTNMQDWMISKKRYWGLALPIWECPACECFEVVGSHTELEHRAVEGWGAFEGKSPHRPWIDAVKITCSRCGRPLERIPDVGNPWLDAGIVPYSTTDYRSDNGRWAEWIPADLVLECFPGQFRNWFYSLLAMSTVMENIPPFKTLVGHALVKDSKGEEMHKSAGNAIWFAEAAEHFGADTLRWLFFENDLTANIRFNPKDPKRIRGGFLNTLWNSYAFYVNYARLIDFTPPQRASDVSDRPILDRWILSKLQEAILVCRSSYEDYDLRGVTKRLTEFLEDLSNWYIRHSRRRFWKAKRDDSLWEFETLFDCLCVFVRLVAPLLPFVSETIYQNLVRKVDPEAPPSVHLTSFPMADKGMIDRELVWKMDVVMDTQRAGLAARQRAGIKARQPLARLQVFFAEEQDRGRLADFQDLLLPDLNVKEIQVVESGADLDESDQGHKSVIDYERGRVCLDTRLTEALEREGMMRELVRKVQVLRKKSKLRIEDRIRLHYQTASRQLKRAIEEHRGYICQELLCTDLAEGCLCRQEAVQIDVMSREIVLDIDRQSERT